MTFRNTHKTKRNKRRYTRRGGMMRRLRFAMGYDTTEDRKVSEIERVEREITKINGSDNPERDAFIEMGKYIMNTALEAVLSKYWLQKGDCNIFLIGENHQPRNFKCIGIYDMFTTLIRIIEKVDIKPSIDIMLELTESEIKTSAFKPRDMSFSEWIHLLGNNTESLQINEVRHLLGSCIDKTNNCPFKVHWSDSNGMLPNARPYDAYPKWVSDLTNLKFGVPAEVDYTPEELVDLLTHHLIVKKEIEKAEKINPSFNMEFSKKIFKEIIKNVNDYAQSDHLIYIMRSIIDFYTSARIIAKDMKNIIVYEGHAHIKNVVYILSKLDYKTVEHSYHLKCN